MKLGNLLNQKDNMKLLSLITFAICIMSVFTTIGQESESEVRAKAISLTETQLLTEASMYTQDGFLYYAEILTEKLLKLKPESPNYN